ncbi:MAG: sensor histidine kinase [Streptosporangiaceae bacterium]
MSTGSNPPAEATAVAQPQAMPFGSRFRPPIRFRAVPGTGAVVTMRRLWRVGLLAVIVVVGTSTFTVSPDGTGNLVAEVIAFVVGVLTIGLWMAADRSPNSKVRLSRILHPLAAGAMAVTAGWAALTPSGGPYSLFCSMATMWAGDTLGLAAATAITGTAVVAVASAGLAYGRGTWDVLGYPLVLVLGLLLGRLVRGFRLRAAQSAALLANAEQLRQEHSRAATLDERNRIAREIHDVLAHSLGALGVQLQAVEAVLTEQHDIDRAVVLVGQARRMATEGLGETRRALQALRADTPPLPGALGQLAAGHQRRYRAAVNYEVTGTPRPLSPDASLALTRTAQESLVNTAKHAPRQPVDVRLDYQPGRTILTVVSPYSNHGGGRPNLETANGGYGLAGMRERLLLIDGLLHAGAADGTWVVTAEIPQ